jgi:hypothetical protein
MDTNARPRAVKACVICHKKKIKCDLGVKEGPRCSPCIRDDYECRPRERKRKRTYTLDSESPPPKARRESAVRSPSVNGVSQPGPSNFPANSVNFRVERTPRNSFSQPKVPGFSGFPTRSHDLESETTNTTIATPGANSNQNPSRPGAGYTPASVSYLGRSEYIGDNVQIDDEEEAPPHSTRDLSDKDMEILQMQRVFELPARSIRESLIDSFWTRCWPWTPIVERSWIEGRPPNETSILLLQGVILAGSRVSSSPITWGEQEEFYKKGKTLFWMGAEKDPLIMAVASLLLNWWNPEGPEHFSIDTSGFWIRICVGLAYQIGIHREQEGRHDSALRRRLWWSLVTRDNLINAGHGRPVSTVIRWSRRS